MTIKTGGLYRRINHFSFFALVLVVFSCTTGLDNKTNPVTEDRLQANTAANIDNVLKDINLADTIRNLMAVGLSKDTFEYKAFYNENSSYLLLYFKTGNLFNSKTKHAITLYSINDTTIQCALHDLAGDKWTDRVSNISMPIDGFSPAYFHVWFDDYNFDGNKDLYIHFYQSMSVAHAYGYILTFNPHNHSLTLHPETIEIPNLDIDTKSKTLTSTVYSNPNIDTENFKVVSNYGWTNGMLHLISKKRHPLKPGE